MRHVEQVLLPEGNAVTEADTVEGEERREHAPVVALVVGNQEVDVLGRADEAIGDDRETPDYDKAGTCGDHRCDGNIEFRFEDDHRLVRRLATASPPERKDAGHALGDPQPACPAVASGHDASPR